MRQLVFDNNYIPADSDRFPRWVFRRGRTRPARPSGWKPDGTKFVHAAGNPDDELVDWMDYRHWDPEMGRYGPIRDYYAYNGPELRDDNVVSDLILEALVSVRPNAKNIVVRINNSADAFFVTLPVDGRARPEARRSAGLLEIQNPGATIRSSSADSPRFQRLEVSMVDCRISATIDGVPAFDPIDFEGVNRAPGPFASPISLGVQGGGAEVKDVKIFRDVFYTSTLAGTPKRPFGVDAPHLLGRDEYFVLGDNSPVSNDSRFWPSSPVVLRKDFVGKPFLVHLPGQLFALKVFGRSLCWIPDPREIRYIR
jgi:signal peptidase I